LLRLVWLVDGPLDLGRGPIGRVDEVDHAHEKHRLRLEAGLVVLIRQDKKDVLQDCDEELVEEHIGCLHVSLLGNVIDQLQAHVKARSLNIAVVVLARPQARVDDKLELAIVEFQQCCDGVSNQIFSRPGGGRLQLTREAVKVDSPEQVEEFDPMLGELGEVLVDHV